MYANERIIGKDRIRNQIFLEVQKALEFRFRAHETTHVLYFSKMSQIISHCCLRFSLSYRIMNPNHKKRIRLTIQYNIHNPSRI